MRRMGLVAEAPHVSRGARTGKFHVVVDGRRVGLGNYFDPANGNCFPDAMQSLGVRVPAGLYDMDTAVEIATRNGVRVLTDIGGALVACNNGPAAHMLFLEQQSATQCHAIGIKLDVPCDIMDDAVRTRDWAAFLRAIGALEEEGPPSDEVGDDAVVVCPATGAVACAPPPLLAAPVCVAAGPPLPRHYWGNLPFRGEPCTDCLAMAAHQCMCKVTHVCFGCGEVSSKLRNTVESSGIAWCTCDVSRGGCLHSDAPTWTLWEKTLEEFPHAILLAPHLHGYVGLVEARTWMPHFRSVDGIEFEGDSSGCVPYAGVRGKHFTAVTTWDGWYALRLERTAVLRTLVFCFDDLRANVRSGELCHPCWYVSEYVFHRGPSGLTFDLLFQGASVFLPLKVALAPSQVLATWRPGSYEIAPGVHNAAIASIVQSAMKKHSEDTEEHLACSAMEIANHLINRIG